MNGTLNQVKPLRRCMGVLSVLSGLLLAACVPPSSNNQSSEQSQTSDTEAPSISIDTPNDNGVVLDAVTISATATDNDGVAGVQFKLDDIDLGAEITSAPYNAVLDTASIANAPHTLTAVARDAAGNVTLATITVTVNNPITDGVAPTSPTNLTATAVSTSQINLAWSASIDNFGVTGYRVYRSGSLVGTVTTTSYSDNNLASGAQYTYEVTAFDAAGNVSLPSATVLASTPAPDSTPPTVAFSNPADTSTVSSTVPLTATASDNVGVAGVQFKLDNNNLGDEVMTAPYSIPWDTTAVANAPHTLTAVARDAAGNVTLATITVTVNNPITDGVAPTSPTNLTATAVSTSQINLTWTAATDNVGVVSYQIYRDGSPIAITAATSYSDTGLTASSTYSYTVAAYDAAGNASAQTSAVSVTTTGSAKSYSTNFDLTENPISEGGTWTNIGLDWTAVMTTGGIAYGTHHATGYNDSYATLSGFAADQSVEATIFITGSFSANQEVELLLRWSQSAHVARGYEILWQARNAYASIVRWNGALGDFTILQRLAFPRAPVTGDVMKAQVVGSLITVYLNGTLVGSFSDSTWATGNPGIGFYSDDPTGSQNSRYGFTSFTAANY